MRAKQILYFPLAFALILQFSLIESASAQCGSIPTVTSLGSTILPGSNFCSPRTVQIRYEITFASALDANTYRVRYTWGDASTPTSIQLTAANMVGPNSYLVVASHQYPGPGTAVCEYQVQIGVTKNSITTLCDNTLQTQFVANWQTDEYNGGQVQLISPTTNTTVHEVCEGVDIDVVLQDRTNWNCNASITTTFPPNGPIKSPNKQHRWQQIIYNTPNAGPVRIPNVSVDGTLMAAAAGSNYADPRGVHYLDPDVEINSGKRRNALQITAPGGFGAGFPQVGQEFEVTILYWNVCNPYTNNPDPTQPPMAPNAAFYGGDNMPVVRTALIRIIDAPDAPTVPSRTICATDSRTLTVSGPLTPAANWRYRWYSDAALTNEVATGVGNVNGGQFFTPGDGPNPGQIQAGQRKHWWVTVEAVAAGSCKSDATEVTLTRRPALTTPAITGPQNLCQAITGYNYTVTTAPANVTITDVTTGGTFDLTTEYNWTVPAGVGTLTGGQGSATITVTANATAGGNGNISVARRYTDVTPACATSPAQTRSVTVRARPTANITPNPADVCEGAALTLNGNPATGSGTITGHQWSGATAVLSADNIQNPSVDTNTPGSYAVSYVTTATLEAGVTCSSTAVNRTINISASPVTASVGANQAHCRSPFTSDPLGGSNPGVGTGTWTRVPGGGAGTISFSNANDPNATATSTAVGIYTLRWTVVNGTCSSSADITVDFGADPGTPNAGTDNEFCGLSGALNANPPPAGTTIAWTQFSGPAGGSTVFSATNVRNPTITVNVYGAYVYRYTISSGTCTPAFEDVEIEFFPPATVQNVANFTTCVDGTLLDPIALSGTFGGGAANAHWERVVGDGTFVSSGNPTGDDDTSSPATDSYTPTTADFTAGSVQLRLVTNDPPGACPSVNDLVTITLDRKPTIVNAGTNFSVCAQPTGPHTAQLTALAPDHSGQGEWSGPPGVSFDDDNSPTAIASGLAMGPNTLTWTVRSARTVAGDAGSCANQQAQVTVTVTPLPVSNAITPIVCQDIIHVPGNPSMGQLQATNVDLTQFSAGLADLPGGAVEVPPGFTVTYFDDPGYTTQITGPITVTNGKPIYTRVTNDLSTCFTNRTITIVLRNQPNPLNHSVQICENNPPGSLVASGINLTSYATNVTGGAANRAVEWYRDDDLTDLIDPGTLPNEDQNYSISATTTLYAKIIDTTPGTPGCHSIAELTLEYQPRPNANFIRDGAGVPIGSSYTVCASGTLVFLQIDPAVNPGSTYNWNIPTPPASPTDPGFFQVLSATNQFYVVLQFPSLIPSPGLPISVTETLGTAGCAGTTISTNIIVEGAPPAPVISGPPTVCANSGATYSVPPVAGNTYSWNLPAGAVITSTPVNHHTIDVLMSSSSGNVTVTVSNSAGCVAPPSTPLGVTVVTRPSMTSPNTATLCSGQAPDDVHTLTGSLGGTTYRWEVTSISGFVTGANVGDTDGSVVNSNTPGVANIDSRTLTNSSGVNAAVIYRVIPVSPPTAGVYCEGNQQNVTITVRPEPSLLLAPKVVCSDEPANYEIRLATVGLPTGTQFTWSAPVMSDGSTQGTSGTNVPAGGNGTIHITDAFVNTSAAAITATYTITAVSGAGCSSNQPVADRQAVITINPKPLISTTLDKAVCSDEPIALTLNTEPGTVTAANYSIVNRAVAGALISHPGNAALQDNVAANYLANDRFTNTTGGPLVVTYTVNAVGSIGACQGPDQVITVTINTGPATNPVLNEVCSDVAGGDVYTEDLTTLQPLVNPDGTLTFQWFTDAALTTPVATPAAHPIQVQNVPTRTGSVFVRVDNGVGSCAKVQEVIYTINPTPAVTADITSDYNTYNVSCIGARDGSITAHDATLGTLPYRYSIDGTNFFTSKIFNGLEANVPYVITVRDNEGCEGTVTMTPLTEPPAMGFTIDISSDYNGSDLSCPGEDDGEITVAGSGGTGSNYSYRLRETNATNTTGIFGGLVQGTYTVDITDQAPNSCVITTTSVTIMPPPLIVASATMSDPASCNGASDGEITVVASGGTLTGPNYIITLNPGNIADDANDGIINGIFTGLAASGVPYIATVTDNNGCSVPSNPVVVTQPAAISAFISVNTSLYPGGSAISCFGANDAQLNVTANGGNGGYSFVLNIVTPGSANATGDATGTYIDVHPGSYSATVTDARGCNITSSQVTVTEPTDINVQQFIATPISCNGDSDGQIRLVATGGTGAFTYVRLDGPPLIPGPQTNGTGIFSALSEFNYSFDVSDVNGCTKSLSVALTQPDDVALTGGVTSTFNGAHISCPTSTNGTITVSAAGGNGNFTYSITDPTVPPPPPPNNSGVFNNLGAGTYTLRAVDPKGCENTHMVTIVPPDPVDISDPTTRDYNGQDVSCTNETDAEITVVASGGTPSLTPPIPGYTYVLTPASTNVTGRDNGVFIDVAPGDYTVTASDANGCAITSISVRVDPYSAITFPAAADVLYLGGREIRCNGDANGQITSTPGGGAGAWDTFTISPTPGTAVNAGNGVFSGLPAGTYVISAEDANDCAASTAVVTVHQPDPLVVSASTPVAPTCFDEDDASVRVSAVGGTLTYEFTINSVPPLSSGEVSGPHNFIGLLPNPGYTVTVEDLNGCTDDVTVAPIVAPSQPLITASVISNLIPAYHGEDITCFGANDAIIQAAHQSGTGTGSLTYTLTGGNVSGQFTGTFTQVGPGNQTVSATDINGCESNSVVVPVSEPDQLEAVLSSGINFGGYDIRCFNQPDGEIVVTPAGGTGDPYSNHFEYVLMQNPAKTPVITPPVPGPADIRFTGLMAMEYRARVRDRNGCTIITDPITLTQPDQITLSAAIASSYGVDGTNISCVGANDGIVAVNASIAGGVGRVGGGSGSGLNDYIYTINPADNVSGAADGRFTDLRPNVLYTITAIDANNCPATAFPVIMFEPAPLFGGFVGSSQQICINQASTPVAQFDVITEVFGGNGSYEYQWRQSTVAGGGTYPADYSVIGGATGETFTPPSNLATTTYYIREVKTAEPPSHPSCPTQVSNIVSVTVNPRPTVTISDPGTICQGTPFGLTFNFTGAAPITFDYDMLETGSVDPPDEVNNVIAGASRTVFINDYQEETTFTVTRVVDRNNCEALPITTVPREFMAQRTVPIVKVLADLTVTSPNPQCSGDTFTFDYTVDPDVTYTFTWPDGEVETITPAMATGTISREIESLNTGSITPFPIILLATHTSCSPLTAVEIVDVYPAIIINVIPSATELCSGTALLVNNNTLGGQDHKWTVTELTGPTVVMDPPATPDAIDQSFPITNTTTANPGTYRVDYVVTNEALTNGGCQESTSFTVDVYREGVAKIGSPKDPAQPIQHWEETDPLDAGTMVTVDGVRAMNIVFENASSVIDGDFEYVWTFSNNNPNTPPQTLPPDASATVDYDFKTPGENKRAILTVTNIAARAAGLPNGCATRDEFMFDIPIPDLVAAFSIDPPVVCLDDDGVSFNIVNDSEGFFISEWTFINENGPGSATSPEFEPVFTARAAGRYRVSLTLRNANFPNMTPVTAPDMFVEVYDAPPIVRFDPSPKVVFVPDQQVRFFNSTVTAYDPIKNEDADIKYTWDLDDGTILTSGINPDMQDPASNHSPVHRYQTPDDYVVRLTATNVYDNIECSRETTTSVRALNAGTVRLPNAFTPNPGGPNGGIVNDDGTTMNDVFLPVTKGIKEFQMQIFDRWGNLVFESLQQNRGWDGYDRHGNLMPAGVYVYKLILRMANDQRTTQVGDVTLIR